MCAWDQVKVYSLAFRVQVGNEFAEVASTLRRELEKDVAGVGDSVQVDPFIGSMGLGNVAGPENHGGKARCREGTGIGAIGNGLDAMRADDVIDGGPEAGDEVIRTDRRQWGEAHPGFGEVNIQIRGESFAHPRHKVFMCVAADFRPATDADQFRSGTDRVRC